MLKLPGGEKTVLGSSDGKVGQRSQPSAGELLKRPGEMMSWTPTPQNPPPPPYVFFPSSYSSGEARLQEQSQALTKLIMHIRETHDS
ncbi:hypothetical protein PAMP_015181 [Pampus punctatissimus]